MKRIASVISLLAVFTSMDPAALAVDVASDPALDYESHAALGIGQEFGRWNKAIPVVYDPDNAPVTFTNDAQVLALIEDAFAQWERISGIDFVLTGVDRNAPDDKAFIEGQDGLVRIAWGAASGASGIAGPSHGPYESNLGYFAYDDGAVELSNVEGVIGSDQLLVNVLAHELGHLAGLGHSDNPDSIMFANPYNALRYPRADDIRAMQVLYGQPAIPVDPDVLIEEWKYQVPPAATATATQYLFKVNQHSRSLNGVYFEIDGTVVTSVGSAAADDEYAWLLASVGSWTAPAIDVAATVVLVDPSGYMVREFPWQLTCVANAACVRPFPVAPVEVMKTLPGTWKVHVVDDATQRTLISLDLPVTAPVDFNRPPAMAIAVTSAGTPTAATFRLTATDPEGDDVTVIWRAPNFGTAVDSFKSGFSVVRTIDFSLAGTHTFFVEVVDDHSRYGTTSGAAAGRGFAGLMRITVTMPAATVEIASTEDTGFFDGADAAVLAAVATVPASLVRARDSASGIDIRATNVGFKLGASNDMGASVTAAFTAGESVIIAGNVSPRSIDLGKPAGIFVVVRTTVGDSDSWAYLDSSGVFVPWPTVSLSALQPAYTVSSLEANQAIEIYSGALIRAQHRIYIGYRRTHDTTLYYTAQAHSLTVN